jgi:23S rRNA pseudouridine955/2504/2580 synthase
LSSHYTFTPADAGQRLDRWLKQRLPVAGFASIQKWLRSGQIRIDGKRVEGSIRIEAGMILRLPPQANLDAPPPIPYVLQQQALQRLQSMMMFEDAHILVLNKPQGLAAQGGTGQTTSVDHLIHAAFPAQPPKLTHRLDKDTSGILILGKTTASAAHLAAQFKTHSLEKIYIAAVVGTPPKSNGIINAPLKKGTDGKAKEYMHVAQDGDAAITHYKVIARYDTLTLLELRPQHGRTHQLRVHCAFMGTPIYGDGKYGTAGKAKLHLHAATLICQHPYTAKRLVFNAPLPDYWEAELSCNLNST